MSILWVSFWLIGAVVAFTEPSLYDSKYGFHLIIGGMFVFFAVCYPVFMLFNGGFENPKVRWNKNEKWR